MWPPPNIQSLPSKEEIQSVKEEMSNIELEIVEAELRLDAMRKSLLERRAWIAPIRTTPPEILSSIFTEASRVDWKAPLVLQSVSRRWRDVVLDSPEAWTFLPLSKYSSELQSDLFSLFLERSRNAPLHIFVGNDLLPRYMELLSGKIQCFHLKTTKRLLDQYLQGAHTLHRLERLRIDLWHWDLDEGATATDDLAAWNMLLFPNLKVLDINSLSSSFLRAILAAPEFPAIQHLKVRCTEPWRLFDIFTKCATSLESVDLSYSNGKFEGLETEYGIHFSQLRYMRLADFSDDTAPRFRFKAATPNLKTYIDEGKISTLNAVKVDTSSVMFLHVCSTPDLSQYPRLATLYFGGDVPDAPGEVVIRATECLKDNPALCPDLALIGCMTKLTKEQLARAKDALMARGEATGHIIQLKEGTTKDWNEREQVVRGVDMCGGHMPCSVFA